jgi:hypothetical protein
MEVIGIDPVGDDLDAAIRDDLANRLAIGLSHDDASGKTRIRKALEARLVPFQEAIVQFRLRILGAQRHSWQRNVSESCTDRTLG